MPKVKSPAPKKVLSAKAKVESGKAKPKTASPVRQGTKISSVIKLLSRAQGATLDVIVKAAGWQPHTVRSVLSRTLPKNHAKSLPATRKMAKSVFIGLRTIRWSTADGEGRF